MIARKHFYIYMSEALRAAGCARTFGFVVVNRPRQNLPAISTSVFASFTWTRQVDVH